jgi:hypothetical protein
LLKRKKKNPTEQDLRITSLLPLLIAFLAAAGAFAAGLAALLAGAVTIARNL